MDSLYGVRKYWIVGNIKYSYFLKTVSLSHGMLLYQKTSRNIFLIPYENVIGGIAFYFIRLYKYDFTFF